MTLLANIFSFSTTFSRMFSRTHKSGYLRATSKKEKASKPLRFQDFQCRVLTEKMRSGKFQASIASYIESYNTQMPHRTLKNLTPCQVEENSIEKAE